VATGLHTPTSFAFGAGTVFEGDGGVESHTAPPNGGVFVLKRGTATAIPGSPQFVAGLAWHKGTLYVSGGSVTGPKSAKWQLLAWSGWNGTTFTKRKAIYTAPKAFQGFNGIAFGPDGRLYVGVDVGLLNGNDHGPAKTPFVYDILSIKPNGHGLKVYATGIRQPWQMAFPRGSSAPLVSDLGQDSPKGVNPPDFVLKVRKGDNYGFPHCNWIVKSKCKPYTKPFKFFPPHTDIMGMAIIGKRLYMTSFLGRGGKGPGGEVLSMPLNGGPVTPVLTGFVAPTVGLGAHAGRLYVGEVGTGLVYSVKP
jgi:glucose/arabinose dehydrogenase